MAKTSDQENERIFNSEEFLKMCKEQIDLYHKQRPIKTKGYYKRTPYDTLNELGLFTAENMKDIFVKISLKQPVNLSSACRSAVDDFIVQCFNKVVAAKEAKKLLKAKECKAKKAVDKHVQKEDNFIEQALKEKYEVSNAFEGE